MLELYNIILNRKPWSSKTHEPRENTASTPHDMNQNQVNALDGESVERDVSSSQVTHENKSSKSNEVDLTLADYFDDEHAKSPSLEKQPHISNNEISRMDLLNGGFF